jgi:hypothetical protein
MSTAESTKPSINGHSVGVTETTGGMRTERRIGVGSGTCGGDRWNR